MMDFSQLRKDNGSFVGTSVDFNDYKAWCEQLSCEGCGKRYVDRPRDEKGHYTETWATETLCMVCCVKQGEERREAENRERQTQLITDLVEAIQRDAVMAQKIKRALGLV